MPRTGMMAIRKDALVNATIAEIGRAGTLDVTMGQIAKSAGVSSALAHHYFGSKDDLLLAAMRRVLAQFGAETRAALAQASTPRGRARAIVAASFGASNFRDDVVAAWLNFYVMAQTQPEAARLLRVYQGRLKSNLTHALRPLCSAPHAGQSPAPSVPSPPGPREVAHTAAALIDGLYIHALSDPATPDAARAIATVEAYLDGAIA